MKRRLFLALAATLPLVAASRCSHAAPRANHVFIISFDGGKPSVMKDSPMPLTMEMARQGAATWGAQAVLPSITLVNHTSMLTGVQPAKHKINWNDWYPDRGLVKVPTVFQVARESGYTTALFAGKPKFRHLNVPGSLDRFEVPSYNAKVVAAAAAKFIVEQKPNLCFIHFADSDGAGHAHGWGSPQQIQAFADKDAALRVVRDAVKEAGIEAQSTFILTADHGGHDKTHGSDSPEDTNIPWVLWGAGAKSGFEIKDAVSTCDTAATALWLLGLPVPGD
jgi:predicted AlkP superfamily pyrophosphatase or phosphodiesterase